MVAPYDFVEDFENPKKPARIMGSRYKVDVLDDDDFSRDVSGGEEEDIGIGSPTGVIFDDEDLNGDKAEMKANQRNNRSKMRLDELELGDTDQSFR